MSLLSGIENIFHKIGAAIVKIFGSTTTEQKILGTLKIAGPMAAGIVAAVDPQAAPVATEVVNEITADFGVMATVVQQGQVAPGSSGAQQLIASANSVSSNLSGLLQVAAVKNSKKIAEITAVVQSVSAAMNAIATELTAAPATAGKTS